MVHSVSKWQKRLFHKYNFFFNILQNKKTKDISKNKLIFCSTDSFRKLNKNSDFTTEWIVCLKLPISFPGGR